jgi:hypothetical protein
VVNDREVIGRIGDLAGHLPLRTAPAWTVMVCDPSRACYLED